MSARIILPALVLCLALALLSACTLTPRPAAAESSSASYEYIQVTGARPQIDPLPNDFVYRALLPDHLASHPDQIDPGAPFRVHFSIGKDLPENILHYPAIGSEVKKALTTDLLQSGSSQLEVALICRFCTSQNLGTRTLRLNSGAAESSLSEWTIRPSDLQSDAATLPHREIQFVVTHNGVVQDVRSSEIGFAGGPLPAVQPAAICEVSRSGIAQSKSADVIIRAFATPDGISLNISTYSQELRNRIGAYISDPNGVPIDLSTGSIGWPELSGYSADIYRQLDAQINNISYLRHSGQPILSAPAQFSLSQADSDQAVRQFYEFGSRLYARLFPAGSAAARAIAEIEKFGNERKESGKPLRISIVAPGGYLPWQMLHAPQGSPLDPQQFWGFKYYISVYPISPHSCGQIPDGPSPDLDEMKTVYLRFSNPSNPNDEVAAISAQFADTMAVLMENPGSLRTYSDKNTFLSSVEQNANDIGLIVTYTHAQSGVTFQAAPSNGYIRVEDPNGPALIPRPGELITSNTLDTVALASATQPYFKSHPIVFLDGCESGTVGGLVYDNGSPLPQVFIEHGASAVIATEASIWSYFGYGFGVELLRELRQHPADEALYNARMTELKLSKNPFGLLFSLYGNGGSQIEF